MRVLWPRCAGDESRLQSLRKGGHHWWGFKFPSSTSDRKFTAPDLSAAAFNPDLWPACSLLLIIKLIQFLKLCFWWWLNSDWFNSTWAFSVGLSMINPFLKWVSSDWFKATNSKKTRSHGFGNCTVKTIGTRMFFHANIPIHNSHRGGGDAHDPGRVLAAKPSSAKCNRRTVVGTSVERADTVRASARR